MQNNPNRKVVFCWLRENHSENVMCVCVVSFTMIECVCTERILSNMVQK